MDILRQRIVTTSNGATAVKLLSDIVAPGAAWEVNLIAVENNSGESVTVKIYVQAGDDAYQIAPAATVADGDAVNLIPDFYLGEGDQILATVKGTSAKGKVKMLISGAPYDLNDSRRNIPTNEVAGSGSV